MQSQVLNWQQHLMAIYFEHTKIQECFMKIISPETTDLVAGVYEALAESMHEGYDFEDKQQFVMDNIPIARLS